MTIASFSGAYFFLSNFYPKEVVLDGVRYKTAEHAYQAQKTVDSAWRLAVMTQPTPRLAKKIGRCVPLRSDWDALSTMQQVVAAKFPTGSQMAQLLLRTHPTTLIEGNIWHDNYWGNCVCGRPACSIVGQNHLGLLLMGHRLLLMKGSV